MKYITLCITCEHSTSASRENVIIKHTSQSAITFDSRAPSDARVRGCEWPTFASRDLLSLLYLEKKEIIDVYT